MDLFRKKAIEDSENNRVLAKCLSAFDLLFLGIGAIVGAGVFVLTGIVAATNAGPAVVVSYLVAALACLFSAFAYAELASLIGGCGSAYGYAYAGFGEFIAWIVGWDLILEYTVSVSAVSVGWSGYFNDLLKALHLNIPRVLLKGPISGGYINVLSPSIIFILSALLIIGVKISTRVNNIMVLIKLAVITMFIVIASNYVETENWTPFMPFGWSGVMQGASLIFFAYIGFDAVSTAAEEAIYPQRDLPIGIIGSLTICTIIYIVVAALLTGIASYKDLNVSSPISHAMMMIGHKTAAGLIGVGAIAGLTTVMLVLFYGLTRIFLAMSRDGLLPSIFAQTNPDTHSPVRVIILCGTVMALLAAFLPLHDLAELVNIGTLFAFVSVCTAVLVLRYRRPDLPRPYKSPGMPLVPLLGIFSCGYLIYNLPWFTLLRFVIWMILGFIVYFSYSRFHSVLARNDN